ncbi:BlaI/MecI/CopY family transcriptional regulator [Hydrogenimonas sp.]
MINFQYLNNFEIMFPGLSMTDAAVAYWVFTIQQTSKEVVMHENRRYVVITAGMLRHEIPMMKTVTDRTVRTILTRLTDAGVLERTKSNKVGKTYAYIPSDRFVMSLRFLTGRNGVE